MRTTINNMVMILTVAGLSLTSSAALAKGGNGGSHSSGGNSFKAFSPKNVQSLNVSNGNQTQTLKKIQSGNLLNSQVGNLNSNGTKLQNLQSGNNIKKMPKILDPSKGNGNSNKIVDMKKQQGNKQNFCKNKCFDKYCWPWWWSSCHSHCYDPCYDPCYDSCYYGCFTPYYTTTVVEVPVVIEKQVIVGQPALGQTTLPLTGAEPQQAVQPVAGPAEAAAEAPVAELMQVPVGATITLRGEAFGEKSGRVAMQVGELLLGSKVAKWEDKAVTITLPQVGLAAAAKGKFLILKADGNLATEVPFQLVPPQAPAVTQQ